MNGQPDPEKTPFLTRSLSTEIIKNIYARTSGGSIEVTGMDTGNTRLEVHVNTNNNKNPISKEDIQKQLDEDYDFTLFTSENKLNVIAKPKNEIMNRQLNISYKIFVLNSISTDLATSGGNINLSNLTGTQNFSTSGGSLLLDKLTGTINGKTSGGNIDISNSSNSINLKSSGGSIRAQSCNGKITLSTSGGSLSLRDLEGIIETKTSGGSIRGDDIKGKLLTRTSGGSIELKDMACTLEASTSAGNVDVKIVKLGEYVQLTNSNGNISLEMPGKQGINLDLRADSIKINTLNNFIGEKEEGEIRGTLNGGGIPITIRAGSGKVIVDFK